MPVGRIRQTRRDLPTGLYWSDDRGYYTYTGKPRRYVGIGRIERNAAIKKWVEVTGHQEVMAASGTVAELIDDFLTEELPRRLRAGKLSDVAAKEYRRQAPFLRTEFGARRYALTPSQSMDPDKLRRADISRYLRAAEGKPGAVAANRAIALLSTIFSAAEEAGRCTYNPCLGVRRNDEKPRQRAVTQADRDSLIQHAPKAYSLMARLTEATGMRLTDVRQLMVQNVTENAIDLKQSKRGTEQAWELTPAVRAILKDAESLPGRARSMYVFPSPRGTPYTEDGVHKMRKRGLVAAGLSNLQHRDLRKSAVNEAKQLGMNATEFAGHSDPRTTEKHYINEPSRVKPIR